MTKEYDYLPPVISGDQALDDFVRTLEPGKRIFFLSDFRTLRKCLPFVENMLPENIECNTLVIQEGERFKNINTCILLWKQLQELKANRDDLFVNVGGGVVTDIGGFVASTYKRGMPYINIPTSLMAMTDAAIGGKTGIDIEYVKNQVGFFSSPDAIYIYPPFLKTLDGRQLLNGYAEVIKHALIADKNFWYQLHVADPAEISEDSLARSVQIKLSIVNGDFKEKGRRKILNFGHTIGHAIESYSLKHDNHPVLHGEAIAMGMICETFLSTQKTGLATTALSSISQYIFTHYPKYNISVAAIPELLNYIKLDKKNDSEGIAFSLLSDIGNCRFNIYCSEDEIITALNVYHDLKH